MFAFGHPEIRSIETSNFTKTFYYFYTTRRASGIVNCITASSFGSFDWDFFHSPVSIRILYCYQTAKSDCTYAHDLSPPFEFMATKYRLSCSTFDLFQGVPNAANT